MEKRSHRFVETHDGFVGFGMDRKSDEEALVYYLQAFSDDALMEAIVPRMTDMEINDLFSRISGLLRKHLSEPEYHRLFLKE
ncbi:MAG: cytoplasmic protein [Deltaproteobacteria bacterium]|nr:cytoplasmic protein [Deltaproteobacteria bacterium]MBW2133585.1 cytoplasmic protein [Deltaproteobacteria bacterium]